MRFEGVTECRNKWKETEWGEDSQEAIADVRSRQIPCTFASVVVHYISACTDIVYTTVVHYINACTQCINNSNENLVNF